jgi:hypothetical protein
MMLTTIPTIMTYDDNNGKNNDDVHLYRKYFDFFYCIIILSFFLLFRKLSLSHHLDLLSQKNQLFSRLKSVELSSVELYHIIVRNPTEC